MSEKEDRGLLDELVDLLARAMDSVGLQGTRLRWRWNQRRRNMGETKLQSSLMMRSARGRHKMCPSCRALVPRSARTCAECGADLSSVSVPGLGRFLANLLPGATATTSLLLLVNGFWFAMMMMVQVKTGEASLLGAFGRELSYRFGSGWAPAILHGEWWRLITPIFLHGGLIHFFFNSMVLLQLGPMVQELYDARRFWVIYLVSGILGNVAATVFNPRGGVVGASGAIFGLIGLLMIYGWRRGGVAGRQLKSFMARWAIIMFIISVLPGISFVAHAGGFLGGIILGMAVPYGHFRNRSSARIWEALSLAGVLLVLFAFLQVALQARQ